MLQRFPRILMSNVALKVGGCELLEFEFRQIFLVLRDDLDLCNDLLLICFGSRKVLKWRQFGRISNVRECLKKLLVLHFY